MALFGFELVPCAHSIVWVMGQSAHGALESYCNYIIIGRNESWRSYYIVCVHRVGFSASRSPYRPTAIWSRWDCSASPNLSRRCQSGYDNAVLQSAGRKCTLPPVSLSQGYITPTANWSLRVSHFSRRKRPDNSRVIVKLSELSQSSAVPPRLALRTGPPLTCRTSHSTQLMFCINTVLVRLVTSLSEYGDSLEGGRFFLVLNTKTRNSLCYI